MNMTMDLRFLFNFSHMDFLLWRNSNRHPFSSVLVTYLALPAAMVALLRHGGRVAAPNTVRYGLEAWCSLCGARAVLRARSAVREPQHRPACAGSTRLVA